MSGVPLEWKSRFNLERRGVQRRFVGIWSRSALRDAEFFQMIFNDGYDRKVKRVTGSTDVNKFA